jgi:Zn-dependent protease with chaperone function
VAALFIGSAAHASPLVERIVDELENSPVRCAKVAAEHPQRRLIEADIARFTQTVAVPPELGFEVLDCASDGFVHRGRTIVLSTRLSRLSVPQRFFIIAHELGHYRLQHRAAMSSFVSQAVGSSRDEASARAAVATGLSGVSHMAELDADAFAVKTMAASGHDPEHAARLFDSLGEGKDNTTHPSSGRRARAIRALRAALEPAALAPLR